VRLIYSPQRSDVPLSYAISGETITATQGEQSDTFDFSTLPDGRAAIIDSTQDPCPVLSARRENGELIVTLRTHHGPDASEAERFPAEEVI
jgi:hypothetical protein